MGLLETAADYAGGRPRFVCNHRVQCLFNQERPLQQLLSQKGKAPHKGSGVQTRTKVKTGAQSDLIAQLLYRQVVAGTGASPSIQQANLEGDLVELAVQMLKYLLSSCRSVFLQYQTVKLAHIAAI